VIVHKAARLHVRVDHCAPDEFETSLDQIFAKRIRFLGGGWRVLVVFPFVFNWFVIHETPNVLIKTAELFLHFKKTLGIIHGCVNFQFITNDTRVLQYLFDSL
jgi:hypothetical protein